MDDAELARRAQSDDATAWAAIYDRYADRLHDYCWSILRDGHEAEDALHDAFITAADRIDQLRDPARLRPWLYAICRTSALGRARRRARAVPTENVAEMIGATDEPLDASIASDDLRRIVWAAAAGLAARDRAVLELHLRHDLVGQDLAEALGVTPHHATVMLGRVRDLVERSLGALLVGRTGRRDCAALDALLEGWDGALSPLLRKRVARHIDSCDVCDECRRRVVSPLALLAAAPLVPAPAALRARVLDDVQRASNTGGRSPRVGRRARVLAGAGAVVALVAVAAFTLAQPADEPAPDPDPVATTAGATSSTAASSTSTSASSTTTVPAPPAARLVAVSPPIDFGQSTTTAAAQFRNDGGQPVDWAANVDIPGLVMTPSRGMLDPGETTTLDLTLDRSLLGEGLHDGTLRVSGDDGDAAVVTVQVIVERAPTVSEVQIDRTSISFNPGAPCRLAQVSAILEDESSVTAVLSWRPNGAPSVETSPMAPAPDGGVRGSIGPVLSPGDGPVTWWIDATDGRGNTSRTADRTVVVAPQC